MFQLAVYCSRNRGYNSRYVLARICKMPHSEWLLAACMAVDAMAILHNLDLLPLGSVVARLLIALRMQWPLLLLVWMIMLPLWWRCRGGSHPVSLSSYWRLLCSQFTCRCGGNGSFGLVPVGQGFQRDWVDAYILA